MRRAAIGIVLLSLGVSAAATASFKKFVVEKPPLKITAAAAPAGAPAEAFEALTSSTGAPAKATLCDSIAAGDKSGNWWCLKGDGTMASGSAYTFSSVGSPVVDTNYVCPSGLDCDTQHSRIFFDGVDDYFTTGAVTGHNNSHATCVVMQDMGLVATEGIVYKAGTTQWTTGNTFRMSVRLLGTTSPTVTVASGSAYARDTYQIHCFDYDSTGGDGTSTMKIYTNGVEVATSAIEPAPLTSNSNPFLIGVTTTPSTNLFKGYIYGVFHTEKYLGATRMASLADQVLGTLTDRDGAAITVARNQRGYVCLNEARTRGTIVGQNRPCVSGGLLWENIATTQSIVHPRDLSNAAYTKTNMTCTNGFNGLTGSPLASRCTATGANATVYQTLVHGSSLRGFGIALRRQTGTGTVRFSPDGCTSTFVDVTSALTSSWQYIDATHATLGSSMTFTAANTSPCLEIQTSGDAVDVDFVQDFGGGFPATMPVDGTTAAVTKTAAVITLPAWAFDDTTGCATADVKVPPVIWSGQPRILYTNTALANFMTFRTADWGVTRYDGTNQLTANATSAIANTKIRIRSHWNSSAPDEHKIEVPALGISASGVYDDTMGTGNTIGLGTLTDMGVGNIKIGTSYTGCN